MIKKLLAVTLVLLLGIEIGLRLWDAHWPDRITFFAQQHSIDWNAAIPTDRANFTTSYDTRRFWQPDDYNGAIFTIVKHERVTVGSKDHLNHVYMFGNSVMFGGTVDNANTIPSYLQRLIPDYQVINLGVPAGTVDSELAHTKILPLHSGDIVIWMDGGQEAFNAMSIINVPDCSLAIIKHLLCATATFVPFIPHYEETIQQGRAVVEARGTVFYHILQPEMLSRPPDAYEQQLLANPNIVPIGYSTLAAVEWPLLEQVPSTIDLTHTLDAIRALGHDVFYDHLHVDGLGDLIIAQAIYDRIDWEF